MKKIPLMLLALLLICAKVEVRQGGFYVGGEYFFPVGVNYMPRDSAIFMWKNFDPDKITTEFKALRGMGVNTVRVFIYWDDINPEPGVISRVNLEQIKTLMDVAHEQGLMVIPTLFTGHMSGGNWAPGWMKKRNGPGVFVKEPFRPPMLHFPRTFRDIYEDELAKDNALLQARTLADELGGHPALLYWDLGNEPQYWQRPRTPELGAGYVKIMVEEIKEHDPDHPVALGMGKFAEDTGFHSYGELGMAQHEDLYIVHTYPAGYYPASAKLVDRYSTWFAGFENSLSRAAGLPVQFQEFGLSDVYLAAMGPAERKERLGGWYSTCLWGSQMAGAQAGVLAWMSGDYRDRLFFREPYLSRPYELSFGVMDEDYRPKASGRELSKFAKVAHEIFDKPPDPHFDPVAILLPENYRDYPGGKNRAGEGLADTHKNHNRFLFSAWLALRQLGINPEFAADAKEFPDARLFIVPALSSMSKQRTEEMADALEMGKAVYIAGHTAPDELSGMASLIHDPKLHEIENAMKPTEEGLAGLRETYSVLLGRAGVKPLVTSSEPFVETCVLQGRYLVAVNHMEAPVRTALAFDHPVGFTRCFYGFRPPDEIINEISLNLPAFSSEVCEVRFKQ